LFRDDGLEGDAAANDGNYTSLFAQTDTLGSYRVNADISGVSNSGEPFARALKGATVVTSVVPPPPGPTCAALFSSAPEFILCGETDTTCSFNARTGGGTCEQMCGSLGVACVGAIDNDGSSCTEIPGSADTCQTPRITEICICERSDTPAPPPPPPPDADCTELFGSAPEFLLCGATETTCSFNAFTDGGTCEQMCASLGSVCAGAIDNDGSSCTEIPGSADTCQTPRQNEICVCERSGGSPPPPPPPGASCAELFGSAPEFLLCGETDTTCSFNAFTDGGTCEQMCGSLGSTCTGATDNDGSSCNAIPGSADTCQTPRQNEICTCAR
jgi:hypothetical protein